MPDPFQWTLDHWPAALLALVPALLNLGLVSAVLASAKRNAMTYSFAGFVAALTVWQFSDALVRFSGTLETAQLWARILGLGALLIAPAGMEFALQFTGRGHLLRNPLTRVGLWSPPILIESFSRARLEGSTLRPDPFWAWVGDGSPPLTTQVYGIWIASLSLGILWVLVDWAWRSPPSEPRRRPALLVAVGFAVPTVQGTVTEVVFPTFLGLPNFPIASAMMTAFSLCAFVALRRYEFLRSPTVEDRLAQAQGELERERQILEHAEQIAHLGSWDWNIATGLVTWSPEMYRLFGLDSGTFRPGLESIRPYVHADDALGFRRIVDAAVSTGTSFAHEHRIVRVGGEVRWVVAHGEVRRGPDGRPTNVYGTSQDITDRRKAEAQRSELERLRSVDEFKTQFLSMAAHELNTPLTPIVTELYLLRLQPDRLTPDERRRSMDVLSRSIQRLAHLVGDLLEAARIQSGRLRIEPRRLDVAPLVDDVVQSFASTAQQAGVTLAGRARGAPVVEADPSRISQVLYNLVSNGIKFTPPGGRVDVDCEASGGDVLFRVSDTGVGLESDQMQRLFQPFTQVHEVRRSNAHGTGLGLYISRTIAELHGGGITVESAGRNRGSTFTVRIPSVQARVVAEATTSTPSPR